MSPKRFFYVMSGLVGLLIILTAASVFGANLFLNSQKEKLLEAKVESRVVEEQQNYLTQAKEDLEKYDELNKITRAIVPQDKDQAKTVREISAIARKSGIQLDTVTFPVSTLGGGAATTTQDSSDSSSSSTSTSGPPSGLTQVAPVEGVAGVYSLEITVATQSPVPYYQFLDFLERLESNRRTANVQELILNPTAAGDSLSFTLILNAYVKP